MTNEIRAQLQKLRIKLSNMIVRAAAYIIKDSDYMQTVQVSVYADELQSDVEHPQEYGYSSNCPVDGAGAVVTCPNGNRDQMLVLMMINPTLRHKELKPGETVMYNALAGSYIKLKEDGTIEMVATQVTGSQNVADSGGTLDQVRQDLAALRQEYDIHVHGVTALAAPTSGPQAPPTP